jgi:hypothetical protein
MSLVAKGVEIMWRSRIVRAMLATGVAILATLALTTNAYASGYAAAGYYTVQVAAGSCLNVRPQPNTNNNPSTCLPNGASVFLTCAVTGTVINGDPYWDRVRDYGGWVTDALMSTPFWQTQTLEPCPPSHYQMNALVIKYFPLTSGTQSLDPQETDVSCPSGQVANNTSGPPCSLATMQSYVNGIDSTLATNLTNGSKYHGYNNSSLPASLSYSIVGSLEYHNPVPRNQSNTQRPDYAGILSSVNICSYMQNQGVNEVWIFAYQSPTLNQIDESKMSGPNGDISNENQHDNMPVCLRTYTVYTFNYGRQVAEAMESHGHQLEAELNHVNFPLFGTLFENNQCNHPLDPNLECFQAPSHCGSVHNPPNASFEHDYGNSFSNLSDCLNFQTSTTQTYINCTKWNSCTGNLDVDEPHYLVWWMQNFPGLGNQATYQGHTMRNWWDVHGDWDLFMWRGGSLLN